MTWFSMVLFLKIATERRRNGSGTIFSISNDMSIAFYAPSLTIFVASMLLLEFFSFFLLVVVNSKSPFDLFAPTPSALSEDSSDFEGTAPLPPTAIFTTCLLPLVLSFVKAAKAAW